MSAMKKQEPEISRIPPQNLEAEQSVLCCMMYDHRCVPKVRQHIGPEDFYLPKHGKIFQAISELAEAGNPADVVVVSNFLKSKNQLEPIGGTSYLNAVADYVPTATRVESYAKIILEASRRRKVMTIAREIQEDVFESDADASALAIRAQKKLAQLQLREAGLCNISTVMVDTTKQIEKLRSEKALAGIPTGFTELDASVGGIVPGELWVPAGRPGMGKSGFAADLAVNAAKRGFPSLIVSLEMRNQQVGRRLLSAASGIENRNLRRGLWDDADATKIAHAALRLSKLPIHFIDLERDWDKIKSKVQSLKLREPKLSLIVFDYLQLIRTNTRHERRDLAIGEISADSKRLALELEAGVVLVSQLSRSTEGRSDKRPQLSDLRESGNIEQDADVVAFIYRDHYYNRNTKWPDLAELDIAKNRDGETGVVQLRFDDKTVSFSDWTK